MKKGIKSLAAAALAISALTPVVAASAAENVANGVYTSTNYYTLDAFKKLSTSQKSAALTATGSVVVIGGQVFKANDILTASDSQLPSLGTSAETYTTPAGNKLVSGQPIDSTTPAPGELKVESVSAINKTTVEVKFNNKVDSVKAGNFTIEGASVTSATLSADKKTATLKVSGLAYSKEYTLAATNILVDGEEVEVSAVKFTTPAVSDLWDLKVEPKSSSITANGADNTEVKFSLVDKVTGEIDKDADNIVLVVTATRGSLANNRVTIQDGQATVLLTSEFSNSNVTSKIDAQIIEASGDYSELIGEVVGSATVQFKTSDTENVDTLTLVAAESNQADRLTLFFDKEISLADVVKTDNKGNLLYNYDTDGDGVVEVTAAGDAIEVTAANLPKGAVSYHALITGSIKVTQAAVAGVPDFTNVLEIQGVRSIANNAKALEVILANPNTVNGNQLEDNERVYVETNITNSLDQLTKSTANFVLTDARNPEVTSVKAEGSNTVIVKFSEAVADGSIRFDGLNSSINTLLNATNNENDITLGEFNAATSQDTRDTATIVLNSGYDWDGPTANVAIPGFFKPGTHSIQVSNLIDHAFASDSSNKGTTQTLQFTVGEDKSRPNATVVTESPEQFRVAFDKALVENDAAVQSAMQLQIYDAASDKWFDLDETAGSAIAHPAVKNEPGWVVEKVSGGTYVVELDTDWTEVFDTNTTNKNFYNYKFRIVVAEGDVTSVATGLKNAEITMNLNAQGSHLNKEDDVSPVIADINETSVLGTYTVSMNEPVKLPNKENAGVTDTPSQDQTSGVPTPTVEFIGTDVDGDTVTFAGTVGTYVGADKSDKNFSVAWAANGAGETPQDIVDAGGSTTWKVVVKSISDDVGNTASTLTKNFTLNKTAGIATPFKINAVVQAGVATTADGIEDTLTLTFSKGVVNTGGTYDATALSQYTLNGLTLPTGTDIQVEDNDGIAGFETVIITLPDGYLKAKNTITVNKALLSNDGTKLTGSFEWVATQAAAPVVNAAPTATAVTITGTAQVGQILTGTYTYTDGENDAEGISTFQWYADGVAISGATAIMYTLSAADLGKVITFEVTPVAATGTTTGTPVTSSPTLTVTP